MRIVSVYWLYRIMSSPYNIATSHLAESQKYGVLLGESLSYCRKERKESRMRCQLLEKVIETWIDVVLALRISVFRPSNFYL